MGMDIKNVGTGTIPPAKDEALKKAAQGFESYFMDAMFKEMRKTVDKDPVLEDQGHEQEMFQEMIDQKVADNVAQRGDFGLGKMLYNQLSPKVVGNSAAEIVESTANKADNGLASGVPESKKRIPAPSTSGVDKEQK